MSVTREVDVEAPVEDVWEALASEEGRERWLDEREREIEVISEDQPHRLVWWRSDPGEPATRVEFLVVATPTGSRVAVTESVPQFPIAMLASALTRVPA